MHSYHSVWKEEEERMTCVFLILPAAVWRRERQAVKMVTEGKGRNRSGVLGHLRQWLCQGLRMEEEEATA